MGRQSEYNEAAALAICARIAEGESLRKICLDDEMPVQSTVFKWLSINETFAKQYAHARTLQMESMAEELLDIADDGRNDYYEQDLGDGVVVKKVDQEVLQRSRLRVDTRKWLMSKLAPKKYGEKVEQFISGPSGGPIQNEITVQFVKSDAPSQS